jgi:two-component system nitrate/nitrite response regulator NarL
LSWSFAHGKHHVDTILGPVQVANGHGVVDRSPGAVRAQPNASPIRILIISDVRFLREGLAEVLPREGMLSVSSLAPDLQSAIIDLADNQPHIVLLDAGLPDGHAALARIRDIAPETPVVVIAVTETADEIIAWAETGAAGYIPKTARLADIAPLLVGILRGKQACSESVAAGLLRRLSSAHNASGGDHGAALPAALTAREAQIAKMIAAGMSNKDIARCLNIGLATAKTHVHHLLGKLNLQRRGQAAGRMREHRDRR